MRAVSSLVTALCVCSVATDDAVLLQADIGRDQTLDQGKLSSQGHLTMEVDATGELESVESQQESAWLSSFQDAASRLGLQEHDAKAMAEGLRAWGTDTGEWLSRRRRSCPKNVHKKELWFVKPSEMYWLMKRSSKRCNGQPDSSSCNLVRFERNVKPAVAKAVASWTAPNLQKLKSIQNVAVIGGGPSGLISAKYLMQLGMNVTIFEAKKRVGGKAYTWVDETTGRAHDLATKWIPTVTANADPSGDPFILGVPPLQHQIIEDLKESGLEVLPSGGFDYFDTEAQERIPEPPSLHKYSKLKIAGDFVQAINIFFKIAPCPGVEGVVDCGVAEVGESTEAWGKRLGIEAFTDLLAEYVDGLGDGQAAKEFIGYPLKSRGYFLLAVLISKLADEGIFDNTSEAERRRDMLPPMGRWGEALLNPETMAAIKKLPLTRKFKQGYGGFWKIFTERYGLNVLSAEKVESVVSRFGKVEVKTSKRSDTFDHVFVAAPPADVAKFMPGFEGYYGPVSALPVESVAWRSPTTTWSVRGLVREPNVALYPEVCESNLGKTDGAFFDGNIYAIADEYSDGIYATIAFPTANSRDRAEGQRAHLEKLGIASPEVKAVAFRRWPSVVVADKYGSFSSWMKRYQGDNHLTFVGEEISGNNVPALIEDITGMFVSKTWTTQTDVA